MTEAIDVLRCRQRRDREPLSAGPAGTSAPGAGVSRNAFELETAADNAFADAGFTGLARRATNGTAAEPQVTGMSSKTIDWQVDLTFTVC